MLALFGFAAMAQTDFSYLCLGMTHGCILAQHQGSPQGTDGFYSALTECEAACPQIGKDLSWQCTSSGNCVVASEPPNPAKGLYPTLVGCANAPGGKCFSPGKQTVSCTPC